MKNALLLALLVAPIALPATAAAQDEVTDLEGEPAAATKKTKKARAKKSYDFETEVIREIERGFYLKSNVGVTAYLLTYGGGILRAGTALSLAVGNDFIDNERISMSWEVALYEGVHNGMPYWEQAQRGINPSRYIQGDTRTYAVLAGGEWSTYPSRRLGIGIRLGLGAMLAPLLMNQNAENYQTEVLFGTWPGQAPAVHGGVHPLAYAGPTIEYYTKLSHFSVGIDVDASYALGFDLGVTGTGFLKYSF